ncbi:MAG: PAS domain S-box protein [Burkholderiales bacterium]|nr:PAS domain S-box protein [Burkholderiales bacterium]
MMIHTTAWVAAAMALSVGLALTGSVVIWQQQSQRHDAQVLLDHQLERLEVDIVKRFSLAAYGLKGARGALAAMHGRFDRSAFAAYVDSRDLPREFPGVRGFGFVQPVRREDLAAFESAQRRDDAPDFKVSGEGQDPQLYVVTQVEPRSWNAEAWGRDIGSEPVRRAALEQAVASGEATLSGPVALAQARQAGPGFLLLVPVYRDGHDPDTPARRRAALQGLLYAPLVAAEVLSGAADAALPLLDLHLSVRAHEGQAVLLLGTQQGHLLKLGDAVEPLPEGPVMGSRRFAVGGREFVLDATLSPQAAAELLGLSGVGLELGGAALSLLAAFTVFLLAAGRARAEALARGMTTDLQRLAMVAGRTSNAVVITDAQRRITWVNEGFTRITGYRPDEVIGQVPGHLLQFEGSDPSTVQTIRDALRNSQGCHVEMQNRSKHGHPYWMDIEIQPLHDATGQLSGFMAIELDITARKEAELALARERNRYAAILEAQTELICRFEADGQVTFVNDAFCRFFGVQAEDMVGHPWAPVVHPEDLARVVSEVARLHPSNPTVTVENRVRLSNGETRWVQFVNRGFFDDRGHLLESQSVGRDITERKRLEAQVQEAGATLQDLYDNAPCAYYALDTSGRFLSVNALGLSWLECTAEDVVGRLRPFDFFTVEGRAQFEANFEKFKTTGRVAGLEFDLTGHRGTPRRVSLSATAIYDAEGHFLRSRSVMFDVTETHRIRQQLHQITVGQEAMLNSDLVGIVKLQNRRTLWRNRALEHMFGYAPGELDGAPAHWLYPDDAAYESLGLAAYPVLQRGERYRTQLQMRRKDGSLIWVDLSGSALPGGDGVSLWMMVDITQSKDHEARMERAALHDALTGLPNRVLLADRLKQAIASAERSGHVFTLAYLDLNGFKQINDTHGHDAGDEVLKAVASRLQAGLRASDTVARLGGDEFVVLLTPAQAPAEAEPVLNRLLDGLIQPITLSTGTQVAVGSSLGLAHFPADGRTPDALMRHADEEMFANKRAGRLRTSANRT